MKKKDLKTGMLIKTRKGGFYLFVNNCLIGKTDWDAYNSFNNDMTNINGCSGLDIISVSTILKEHLLKPCHWNAKTMKDHLLWTRPVPSKMITVNGKKYSEDTLALAIKEYSK